MADKRELPAGFLAMIDRLGLDGLAESLCGDEPSVAVRVNRRKSAGTAGCTRLKPEITGSSDSQVPWCPGGYYLPERPVFTLDPAFHQGRYYVQEASSMFHNHVVKTLLALRGAGSAGSAVAPVTLLDACAAPGGKTTAAIDALHEGSVVVANEYVPARAAILRENAIKWGFPGIIVTRGDTRDLGKLRDTFDIIIADVPCSGEGMMRKDADAVSQWSEGLIEECAERQWEIVSNLWDALRPGGFMIYSTCTFNRRENEETVARIIDELGGESVEIPVEENWGISGGIDTPHHCYRFLPGKVRGEGLFVAVVRKDGDMSVPQRPDRAAKIKTKGGKGEKAKNDGAILSTASGWLKNSSEMDIYVDADRVTAFPKTHSRLLKSVKERVDVIHEGVQLGTVKGKDVIPSQSLAMSLAIDTDNFSSHDLNREEALKYLRGDAIVLPESVKRGFVLLTYEGVPLGFVKNLGNRSNNLYPAPWRIKHL